jgi:type IV fimbrial biogenesis protein FimT
MREANKPIAQHGFSLIELMVTIAIMVLLMAAVAPSMTEWIANVRLRGAAEVALTGLQRARAEAIKTNQFVSFWLVSPATASKLDNTCALSAVSPSWVISLDDPSGACASEPSATVAPLIIEAHGAGKAALGANVSALSATNAAATQVRFNGFGQRSIVSPDPDIRTIDFTSTTTGTRRLRIEVSPGGSVRLCDRDAPVLVPPDPRACLL